MHLVKWKKKDIFIKEIDVFGSTILNLRTAQAIIYFQYKACIMFLEQTV